MVISCARFLFAAFAFSFCLTCASAFANMDTPAPRYKAVAFDYFVLFNPNSVVPAVEKVFPGKGQDVTKAWRSKQFEYGFLRSITDDHKDFFRVTEDALTYTLENMGLTATDAQKKSMLDAYLNLSLWPDSLEGLQTLRDAGVKIITIANFSKAMLAANADHANIKPFFDILLSTEVNKTYKPDAAAYALGMQKLGLERDEIVFAAFGGWDAYGAKKFGYPTVWVNRLNLPAEQLIPEPDVIVSDFDGLLDFVIPSRKR